jgi:hypothetical protein
MLVEKVYCQPRKRYLNTVEAVLLKGSVAILRYNDVALQCGMQQDHARCVVGSDKNQR